MRHGSRDAVAKPAALFVRHTTRSAARCVHRLLFARAFGDDDLVHLLIAGIPASGKSSFARWLVDNHDYVRCPSGEEPGASFLTEIDQARSAGPNVVIDWGFPVRALPIVRELVASGVEPWWFDGDRDAALQAFLARPDHPATKADWDVQLAAIEEHWHEIADMFRDRILNVVSPGPTHLSSETCFRLIGGSGPNP